jgi:hypothetical protein
MARKKIYHTHGDIFVYLFIFVNSLDKKRHFSEYLYIPPLVRGKRQVNMLQTVEPAVPGPEVLRTMGTGAEAFHDEEFHDEEFHAGKIYCANCIHCKLVTAKPEGETAYLLRVRCAAGKWKKKLGEEKLYKYCTITRRHLDSCDAYEEMGDTREFIRELRKTLPNKDEPWLLA